MRMTIGCFRAILALAGPILTAAGADRKDRPVPAIEKAIIISCDGLRPDLLLRAKTPNMHRLFESGSYSFWARTVPVSVTLPSHTSMLTGFLPEKHGITWNDDQPDAGYPKVPTIFEIAKKAGLTTAMVTGKSKFKTLNKPGTVDWASIAGAPDEEVGKQAKAVISEHKPDLLFIHFPGADSAGHGAGWGSAKQIEAIENIDKQLGIIFKTLDDRKLLKKTVILLSADHGGAGRSHGPDDPRSRHIPWIIAGPGIKENNDLTGDPTLVINTEDTFSTICMLMGLEQTEGVEGKAVVQILAKGELLKDSK